MPRKIFPRGLFLTRAIDGDVHVGDMIWHLVTGEKDFASSSWKDYEGTEYVETFKGFMFKLQNVRTKQPF